MKTKPMRNDWEFYKLLKEVKIERIKRNIDKIPQSDRRLTKAVARLFKQDKIAYESLIVSPLEIDTIKARRLKFK